MGKIKGVLLAVGALLTVVAVAMFATLFSAALAVPSILGAIGAVAITAWIVTMVTSGRLRIENWRATVAVVLVFAFAISVSTPAFAQSKSYRDATSGFLNETTFLASAARTTSGDSSTVVDLGAYSAGNVFIDVTAVSGGSPSMTVTFQSCPDTTVANCHDHTSGSAITATGKQLLKVNNFGRYVLIKYAITGTTPSFTFSVKGAFKPTT